LLQVGDALGGGVEAFSRLTATFESLPQELDGQDLREASSHLSAVAREAAHIAAALSDEENVLTRLRGSVRKVGSAVAALRKMAGAISLLSVNAQIGAAHLSGCGVDFAVFTKEVARLAKTIEATVRSLDHDHANLDALLRSAQFEHAEFGRRYGHTLRSVAEQLSRELGLVQSHRTRAAVLAAEIGARSRRIAEKIGAAVMSLQIGDRTRQRLEHVGYALDLMRQGLITEPDTWGFGLDEDTREAVMSKVCLLQSAQVSQAVEEFSTEINQIAAALRALAADACGMVDLGADAFGDDAQSGSSFLHRLKDRVSTVSDLMNQCHRARAKVDGVTDSLSRTLGRLVQQVEAVGAIEINMRLIGLNAAFKCGRLGNEGQTLSAIAHELRACAGQTVEDTRLLMGVLEEVMTDTGASNSKFA
jgi:hypothetical protein